MKLLRIFASTADYHKSVFSLVAIPTLPGNPSTYPLAFWGVKWEGGVTRKWIKETFKGARMLSWRFYFTIIILRSSSSWPHSNLKPVLGERKTANAQVPSWLIPLTRQRKLGSSGVCNKNVLPNRRLHRHPTGISPHGRRRAGILRGLTILSCYHKLLWRVARAFRAIDRVTTCRGLFQLTPRWILTILTFQKRETALRAQ